MDNELRAVINLGKAQIFHFKSNLCYTITKDFLLLSWKLVNFTTKNNLEGYEIC